MKMLIYISMIVSLLFYGCKKEEFLDDTTEESFPESLLPVVWQVPLAADTTYRSCMYPVFFNNGIIYSAEKYSGGHPVVMKMADTADAGLIWETDAAFNIDCNAISYLMGNGSFVFDHYYATLCNSDPRVVDLNNGSIVWHYECEQSRGTKLTNFGNKIFHTHQTGSNPYYSGSIVMADIQTGIWDTIYTIDMVDDYSVGIYPPAAEVNGNNDTILYFQNRQWKSDPYDGKIDLYCYNMSADTLVWMNADIDFYGNSAIYPPLLHNGKVYFKGTYSVYCFDAATGEKDWDWTATYTSEDLLYANLLEVDGKIIVKTSGESIYALDAVTGDVIWDNQDAGATPTDIICFNGIIYYGSDGDGLLHAIDVNNGDELWAMESPNKFRSPSTSATLGNKPAIDPVLKRLYISDGYYFICFQLNP